MRHLRADVNRARHRIDRVKVIGKAFPSPLDPFGECRARNILDPFHQADQEILLPARHRRETDAAISHHDSSHAMPARGRQIRIPRYLAVVMRMDIDESRSHQHSHRVDFTPRRTSLAADTRDYAIVDRDVADERGRARAVNNLAVTNYHIMHDTVS